MKHSKAQHVELAQGPVHVVFGLQVLRFYCMWDDRQKMYGDRRRLRLHFYLEDSTAEILEDVEQNSGREHFPVFLQRGQLPKVPIP